MYMYMYDYVICMILYALSYQLKSFDKIIV